MLIANHFSIRVIIRDSNYLAVRDCKTAIADQSCQKSCAMAWSYTTWLPYPPHQRQYWSFLPYEKGWLDSQHERTFSPDATLTKQNYSHRLVGNVNSMFHFLHGHELLLLSEPGGALLHIEIWGLPLSNLTLLQLAGARSHGERPHLPVNQQMKLPNFFSSASMSSEERLLPVRDCTHQ